MMWISYAHLINYNVYFQKVNHLAWFTFKKKKKLLYLSNNYPVSCVVYAKQSWSWGFKNLKIKCWMFLRSWFTVNGCSFCKESSTHSAFWPKLESWGQTPTTPFRPHCLYIMWIVFITKQETNPPLLSHVNRCSCLILFRLLKHFSLHRVTLLPPLLLPTQQQEQCNFSADISD